MSHITKTILLALLLIAPPLVADDNVGEIDAELHERIEILIDDLNSKRFTTRQSSEQELLRLGKSAAPQMRLAIEDADGEAKIRLQQILTELDRSIRIVEKIVLPELKNVTSVALSPDGEFLYAAAFATNTITVFSVQGGSGRLSKIQTITDDATLRGSVALRLSHDDARYAVASCFSGKCVTLFSRDPLSGKLEILDTYKGTARSPTPTFPIEATFTPNGKFIYVLDGLATHGRQRGGIMILEITDDQKLQWVDTCMGERSCFSDVRGIAFHPTRNEMYITASTAGTLTRAAYDPDTGAIEVNQVLSDGKDGVLGLSGAFSVDISSDGNFVYTSSGRFRGDSAVGVYTFDQSGNLQVVQELISGREKLDNFLGGNELVISADGRNVYVTGTRSSTLAGFARDSETGKLSFIETVPFGKRKLGPAGITISPDGGYVYAAVEGESAIAVFRRDLP